ncbi:MAG: ABC transporter permease subunit [Enhydrobacter sp.]
MLGVSGADFDVWIDLVLQRVMDILREFPLIVMALEVVAIFGSGVQNVIATITIPLIPRCARLVRVSALAIREAPYIDAAQTSGVGHARIILRHMVPNVVAPFLIMLQGGAEKYASTALTVFGFSLFGDTLRNAIDPRLRER